MTTYVAFLRGINIGGHNVTKDRLIDVVAGLGHDDVETFIASGNVIFTSGSRSPRTLERAIEKAMGSALGYDVPTYVRSIRQLGAVADELPFEERDGWKIHVGFLAKKPTAAVAEAVADLGTDFDDLAVAGTEVFWRTHGNFSASKLKPGALEKALGQATTLRNVNTVHRLLDKYGG